MTKRKTLQELTLKDNYMFGAVMTEESNCRRFLEMTLGFPISHLEINKEKCIAYHPEQKGVRLDIYAKDGEGTRYNVEMQVISKKSLSKRSRYYHRQIDMELLPTGVAYDQLPDSYVIFVCDFDPFGKGKFCYTFANQCFEAEKLILKDGCCTVFLSTRGHNEKEVSKELVNFLRYVGSDTESAASDPEDDFVKQLQRSVEKIRIDHEKEERYMLFEELLMDERLEGRIEGQKLCIFDLLEELGPVPETLKNRIENEQDPEKLKRYLKKAISAASIEQFQKEIL